MAGQTGSAYFLLSDDTGPSLRSFREQNDILTWLFEISKQEHWTVREITSFMLLVNLTAIHTTTLARKPTVAHKTLLTLLAGRHAFNI